MPLALRRADRSPAKVCSFDVFDTCIARRHLRPYDLLVELAALMLADVNDPLTAGPEAAHELADARLAAAGAARQRLGGRDPRLVDIYDEFDSLAAWGVDRERMMAEEMALERRSVRPIATTRRRIQQLRAAGHRIVFVSDMYLDTEMIRQLLLDHDIAQPDEAVYVSCDLGCSKADGRLFAHVLQAEGITARELTHVGDSVLHDVLAAKRNGVHATLFSEALPNRYEDAMLRVSVEEPHVDARLAGLCRTTRLALPADPVLPANATTIAADVVAPLLTSYVLWVLRTAQREGIERLYFLARDGQVLLRIARRIVDGLPDERFPELRYLYGSRQAWMLPSVLNGTRDELAFAVLDGQSNAVRHCLARLELDPEDIAEPLAREGFDADTWDMQLDPPTKDRLWRVLEHPDVAGRIAKNAAQARSDVLAYLHQEGLFADRSWALVDVGWTLRAQASLRRILQTGGQPHLDAFYLGLSRRRFTAVEYGSARGFLLEESEVHNDGEGGRPLFENKGLIDQIFTMADHGTTRGYLRDGATLVPDLAPMPANSHRDAFQALVAAAVDDFAGGLVDGNGLVDHADELKRAARRSVHLFLSSPSRADVEAVAWASISDDPNELRHAPLARHLSVVRMGSIALHTGRRARRTRHDQRTVPTVLAKDLSWGFSWLEGSLTVSGLPGRAALGGLRLSRRVVRRRHHHLASAGRVVQHLPIGSLRRTTAGRGR